jgi:hypothetical protein
MRAYKKERKNRGPSHFSKRKERNKIKKIKKENSRIGKPKLENDEHYE